MDSATQAAPDPPPAAGADPKADGGRRFRRPRWLVAAVLAVALAVVGYGGWQLYQRHETDVAAEQAMAAAQKYMHTLTNFNSDSESTAIGENMDSLLNGATGEFKEMYAKFRTKLLNVQVEKNAAARGTVVDSMVKSASKDKVVVVLLVDQSVTNTDNPDPQLDRSRVRMTMNKVDGRWLVGYLEAL